VPSELSSAERGKYEATLFLGGLTASASRTRPDVVVGFSPSLAAGAAGALAAAAYRRPYVLIVHDLLGPGIRQTGVGSGRVAGIVGAAELRVARSAARIGIIAEGFRGYFLDNGADPGRIERLRVWTQRSEASAAREQTRQRFGWTDDEFVCLHAGNMGQKQGLDTLLSAAESLRGSPVRMALAGDGNDRTRLESIAEKRALDNVSFIEMQPPGDFEAMLEAADLLLVTQRASVGDMSLPSKLTAYFAAGQPVLAAVSPASETAREMEAADAGRVVEAENPALLAEAISDMRDQPDQRRVWGENARVYSDRVLSAEAALRDYEDLLVRAAREPARSRGAA
jgi:glycosyltransferase involved in cell wall biosynthesis